MHEIDSFALLYFMYCKISNLYSVLFLFSFYYFCKEISTVYWPLTKACPLKKKKKKRFLEGRDQLGCIHMEGKDSLKEGERYSDFQKKEGKEMKKGWDFFFSIGRFSRGRDIQKRTRKKRDWGDCLEGKKENRNARLIFEDFEEEP